MKIITLGFVLALFAFGCSKKEAMTNLGTIDLVPNTPKHLNIGGHDWIFTETLVSTGKLSITAKSAEWKVTQADISRGMAPSGTKVGSTVSESVDLSNLPTGVETLGYFGQTLTRFILKHDSK